MHIMRKIFFTSLTSALIVLSLAAAASAQAKGKPPVVIIPGVTGSELVNSVTGRTVWFSIRRDKDDDLRLPINSTRFASNKDSLRAGDIIREVELPVLPDVEVYKTLIEALEERGYTEATWDKPKAEDAFYVLAYDWRRDNVETAQMLIERMAAAKRALKRPDLKFDILAHSMGGLISRYAAMYGSADLPASNPRPTWAGAAHISKLMMFGTPNEGSMSSLDALLNGYPVIADRKLPLVDDLRAEDVMSSPASFQLLPPQRSVRFLDEELKSMKVDLYDVDTWLKYGWGAIADPKFLAKLKDAEKLALENKEIKPDPPKADASVDDRKLYETTYAQAVAYLKAALDRAARFQAALSAQSGATPIKIFGYGGNCTDTLDAAILVHDAKKERWQTIFEAKEYKTASGRTVKKDEVKGAIFTIGDGRVTQRSLLSETSLNGGPEITNIQFASSFFGCGSHTKLFLEKPIKDSFLSSLVVEQKIQP